MKKLITNIEPSKQVKATVVCIAALLLSTSWQVASAKGKTNNNSVGSTKLKNAFNKKQLKLDLTVVGFLEVAVRLNFVQKIFLPELFTIDECLYWGTTNTFYPDECDYYYSIAAIRLDLFVMHQSFHIFFTKSYLIKLL